MSCSGYESVKLDELANKSSSISNQQSVCRTLAFFTAVKISTTENMTSEEPNSTIQLLGLSAPVKKVEIKAMSGENAAIMGELRSLRNDIDNMQRSYTRARPIRKINEESRSEDPAAFRVSPNDIRRMRTGFRPVSLNGNRDKDE